MYIIYIILFFYVNTIYCIWQNIYNKLLSCAFSINTINLNLMTVDIKGFINLNKFSIKTNQK